MSEQTPAKSKQVSPQGQEMPDQPPDASKVGKPRIIAINGIPFHSKSRNTTASSQVTKRCRPEPVYVDLHDGVENVERYVVGGYHPTHIGDLYHNERYKIVHKLGHGTFSTVWLARDMVEEKNVALKISCADVPAVSHESQTLGLLKAGQSDHPGRCYVTSLLDKFGIEGPNGKHHCLVMPVSACSASKSKDKRDGGHFIFPMPVARSIAAQVLLGLDYIHSCGVIHGDLHTGNILIELPGLDQLPEDELYAHLGEPKKQPLRRRDGLPLGSNAPAYSVSSAMLVLGCGTEVKDPKVLISDFGESFLITDEDCKELHTPMILRPPESFFGERIGPKADIWTMGCTLFEILGCGTLFENWFPDMNQTVTEMISTLGPIPTRWWDKWSAEGKSMSFNQDGTWKEGAFVMSLADRMRTMASKDPSREAVPPDCSEEEFASLETLFKIMLTYEPAERATASDVVASEWVQKWAIPAITEPSSPVSLDFLAERRREWVALVAEQDKRRAETQEKQAKKDALRAEDEKSGLCKEKEVPDSELTENEHFKRNQEA
ncbi:kinase-like protein [Lophium mytilinum]|uniref:non-specific serine/threonine protein kinase n=1 Tax=Lophium mytilinum TaxID=390894 RepID=A0A6A6QQA6_9PEZI|nr:kinase-like protein [Lophium mytilinum]